MNVRGTNKLALAGAALAIVTGIGAVAIGCAEGGGGGRPVTPVAPGTQVFPLSPGGGVSTPNLASVPLQIRSMMMGSYYGQLFKQDWQGNRLTQGYNLLIQESTGPTGLVSARMVLDSDGLIGPIHLEGTMAMGWNGFMNRYYSIASEARTAESWLDSPVSVVMLFDFSTFPARSSISILECGFYQGAGCGVSTDEVGFEPDSLRKR